MQKPPPVRIVNLLPSALIVVGVLLLLSFFGRVSSALLAVTLAVLLATALNPVVVFFERWMPRGVAAVLTVLLVLGGLLGLVWLAVPPIAAQFADLLQGLPRDAAQLEGLLREWLDRTPQLAALAQQIDLDALARRAVGWLSNLFPVLLSVTGAVASFLVLAVVTFITLLFALSNPVPLINGVLGALPQRHRPQAREALANVLNQMGAWGRAQVLVMLIIGVGMAAGLYLLGVENWLVFGVISALGELIPNLGPVLAAVPPVLFTLLGDPQLAFYVAAYAVVLQQVEGNLIVPLLMGKAAEMHPFSITVGAVLFGSVFGLVGAVLAVPFLIVIKAVYETFYLDRQPEVSEQKTEDLIHGELAQAAPEQGGPKDRP
ncbi:putative PurR-regulated permease PerM [Deinococcus budaensis]|uniref:Putative PurR-regulated permease PerM n=1 Tax=Deinococcus budaensis TaxID=1665626 RepID=A0A7W8LQA8_9DEIO|nr:AI-2E family transporter [Deinococcus budaensis]MBB5234648.1 putative PurR-regulated permease PerM [Deinococcus budaensis]